MGIRPTAFLEHQRVRETLCRKQRRLRDIACDDRIGGRGRTVDKQTGRCEQRPECGVDFVCSDLKGVSDTAERTLRRRECLADCLDPKLSMTTTSVKVPPVSTDIR
jgi:hypothetical protein